MQKVPDVPAVQLDQAEGGSAGGQQHGRGVSAQVQALQGGRAGQGTELFLGQQHVRSMVHTSMEQVHRSPPSHPPPTPGAAHERTLILLSWQLSSAVVTMGAIWW
jgi:hypothetical protein